ncbi:MAG: hypothetical protein JEZ08_16735 [Clostridiales bacterium]|nr:hypothetical protein [Clostridiales bacterium]
MNFKFKIKSTRVILLMCLIVAFTSVLSYAQTTDDTEKYIDQLINNTQNSIVLQNSGTEYVNPFHGNLNLKYVDMSLPGINGLDFNLIREYNSHSAYAFDIDQGVVTDSQDKIRSNIGAGWSFNIPYVKELGTSFQVNLGEKGNYLVEDLGTTTTQAVIKGYENHTMNFYALPDRTECVVNGQQAILVYELGNGTKYYFGDDLTLMAIRDRYGNQITYEYTVTSNSLNRQPDNIYTITRITDTLGRVINFNYTTTGLVVSVTGEGKTQSVTYVFDKFSDITSLRPEIIPSLLVDSDRVLKSVTNTAGMTTAYTYNVQAGRKNDTGKTITTETKDILYALVDSVSQPGGLNTKYEYITSIRNNGYGAAEFYKISKRFDEIPSNVHTSYVANTATYGYSFDAGGEYDGYPNYNNTTLSPLPDDFRVRVAVTTESGLTDYVGDKDLKIVEILSTTDKLVTKETKKYDNKDNVISVTTEISDPTTSNDPIVSTQLFEYDTKGRKTGVWGTQTPTTIDVEGNYVPSNDEYKTTILYDDRFNIPTSTKYKQDVDTTIENKNVLSSDGKDILTSEMYENNILKSKTSFVYDSFGNLTANSIYDDSMNKQMTNYFSYADTGKNAFVTRSWTDAFTDIDGIVVPSIQTTSTYDYFGNQLTTTDAKGNVTAVVYDNLNRPTTVTNPDNTTVGLGYTINSNGFYITKTDELNNQFKLVYSSLGQLLQLVDLKTNNVHVTNEYNSIGQLIKSTDALGNYSVNTYYKSGEKETSKFYASDNTLLNSQNFKREIGVENGKYTTLTTETIGDVNAPTQRKTAYVNKYGLLEKNVVTVNGSLETENFTYDYIGRNITFTSARVNDEALQVPYSWKKEYDYAGNVIKFFNADSDYATSVYNALGQLTESYDFKSVKSATPYATKNTYDKIGRLIKTEIPFDTIDGQVKYSVKEYKYDANNNLVEERTSNNKVTELESFNIKKYEYDKRNRLVKVTLENGSNNPVISQYYYDAAGNQVRMYTGLSSPLTISGLDQVSGSDLDYSVTKMNYDHLTNLTEFIDPMGQSETFAYDLNGNMTSKTDRNDTVFSQSYDGLGRLTQRTGSNGAENHTTGYVYNQIGLLKEVNDNGYVESFEYDDRGLVLKHNYPDYHVSYMYDVSGNVKRSLSFEGINHIQTSYNTFDVMDRLSTVSDLNDLQATYTYDANGNRKDLKYTTGQFGVNYNYNLLNKVTGIDNFNSGAVASAGNPLSNVLPDYEYVYKLDGTQLSEKDTTSGIIKNYDYDDINRLVNESKTMNSHVVEAPDTLKSSEDAPDLLNDYSLNYTYDDYGNILTRVDASKTTTYTYDKNNRILTETEVDTNTTIIKRFSYDKNGNTISDRTEVYSKVLDNLGSSIAAYDSSVKIYEYNLSNQQIKVTTKNGETSYTYNASGLRDSKITGTDVTKFFWNGNNIIGEKKNNSIIASYLYGAGLIRRKDFNTNEKNYYFFNVHGDVVALTDDTGEVMTVYDYNAYGEFASRGQVIDNPFTYFGQYYDEETGSYYLRARYYNPNYMRFTQEDLLNGSIDDALSLNRYLYCSGNPINFYDPSGYKMQVKNTYYVDGVLTSTEYYFTELDLTVFTVDEYEETLAGATLTTYTFAMSLQDALAKNTAQIYGSKLAGDGYQLYDKITDLSAIDKTIDLKKDAKFTKNAVIVFGDIAVAAKAISGGLKGAGALPTLMNGSIPTIANEYDALSQGVSMSIKMNESGNVFNGVVSVVLSVGKDFIPLVGTVGVVEDLLEKDVYYYEMVYSSIDENLQVLGDYTTISMQVPYKKGNKHHKPSLSRD